MYCTSLTVTDCPNNVSISFRVKRGSLAYALTVYVTEFAKRGWYSLLTTFQVNTVSSLKLLTVEVDKLDMCGRPT